MTLKRTIYELDRAVNFIMLLLSLLLFLLGCYFSYDLYHVYSSVATESIKKYKPVDENGVLDPGELSDDCVAWITFEDTGIDYPIMQGEDNNEYLNKDPYGDYSMAGSIFLDMRCSPDFTDPYSLVYGHHMAQKAMFGALDDFREKEFFDKHRHGTLEAGSRVYDIELFAVADASAEDEWIFDPSRTEGPLQSVRDHQLIWYDIKEGSRIIGLTTCQSPKSMQRTCVFGVLTEKKATDPDKEIDQSGREDADKL